jgi:hypothetical protein
MRCGISKVRTGICQTAECLIDHAVDSRCIAPGQRVARQPHHIAHLLHAAVGEQGVRACIDLHRLQGQWSERRGQGADVGDASSGGAMCQPARGAWSGRARAERPEAGSRQIAAHLAQQGVESAEQLHAAGNVHQQTIGLQHDSGGVTQCAAGSVPQSTAFGVAGAGANEQRRGYCQCVGQTLSGAHALSQSCCIQRQYALPVCHSQRLRMGLIAEQGLQGPVGKDECQPEHALSMSMCAGDFMQ